MEPQNLEFADKLHQTRPVRFVLRCPLDHRIGQIEPFEDKTTLRLQRDAVEPNLMRANTS